MPRKSIRASQIEGMEFENEGEEETITESATMYDAPGVSTIEDAINGEVIPMKANPERLSPYEIDMAEDKAKMAALTDILDSPVPAEIIKVRPGPAGMKLSYISGETAIRLANKTFGWNKWDTGVGDITIVNGANGPLLVYAKVCVTAFGISREDVGVVGVDGRTDLEMAIKGAVTDGMKRALRLFGEHMGNSLYADTSVKTGTTATTSPMGVGTAPAQQTTTTNDGGADVFACQFPGCTHLIEDWTNNEGRLFTAAYRAGRSKELSGKVLCGQHMSQYKREAGITPPPGR